VTGRQLFISNIDFFFHKHISFLSLFLKVVEVFFKLVTFFLPRPIGSFHLCDIMNSQRVSTILGGAATSVYFSLLLFKFGPFKQKKFKWMKWIC